MLYTLANRVHISETTYRNLKKTGMFHMQSRGNIDVKVGIINSKT